MADRTETNLEWHARHRAKILNTSDDWHDSTRNARRWMHLLGDGFAEHGWPLAQVPEVKSILRWMSYEKATALLIAEIPWCAKRAAEFRPDRHGPPDEWFTKIYCRCPAELVLDRLGLDTALQLQLMSFIASDVGDLLDFTTLPNRLNFVETIRRSYWHASCYSGKGPEGENTAGHQRAFYNRIAGIIEGIRSFEFGIVEESASDFTTYADTAATMRWGHGVVDGTHYSDAHLTLNICRGDQHVLSIGFSPTEYGIAICQVQLKQRTGNRWLFVLGEHFLDYTLERMHQAFPGEELLLVSGESAAGFVASNYKESSRPEPAVLQRVKDLYSRPLTRWSRKADPIRMSYIGQRDFHGLVRPG